MPRRGGIGTELVGACTSRTLDNTTHNLRFATVEGGTHPWALRPGATFKRSPDGIGAELVGACISRTLDNTTHNLRFATVEGGTHPWALRPGATFKRSPDLPRRGAIGVELVGGHTNERLHDSLSIGITPSCPNIHAP